MLVQDDRIVDVLFKDKESITSDRLSLRQDDMGKRMVGHSSSWVPEIELNLSVYLGAALL